MQGNFMFCFLIHIQLPEYLKTPVVLTFLFFCFVWSTVWMTSLKLLAWCHLCVCSSAQCFFLIHGTGGRNRLLSVKQTAFFMKKGYSILCYSEALWTCSGWIILYSWQCFAVQLTTLLTFQIQISQIRLEI